MQVLDTCEVENSANENDFLQILIKIVKATILRSMDTETLNFQLRLDFCGSFQKLVLYC